MKKWHMVAYSVGSLGTTLSMQCFNTLVPIFYIDRLKLSPALFGISMTIYAIWNALNDPLAGQISDRTRTRWGRRTLYVGLLIALWATRKYPLHGAHLVDVKERIARLHADKGVVEG
jgi:Na+/melibiose symporter-like transporter